MHIGKVLARLNPKNVRFDVGSGGIPELTPSDIAAALAFVPAGLGRELICRIWWPDGAQLTAKALDELIMESQLSEWRDRATAILDGQLAVACADTAALRIRARQRLENAKARMWPRVGPESCYAPIRQAVLVELGAGRCPHCQGRTIVLAEQRIVSCPACAGSGRLKISERSRAEMIGKDFALYRRQYAAVYEWTLELCERSMAPAHDYFKRAVA
jgi:hypothetical protein